jgi:hypothetical protein
MYQLLWVNPILVSLGTLRPELIMSSLLSCSLVRVALINTHVTKYTILTHASLGLHTQLLSGGCVGDGTRLCW